jgi:hypothetical protein
MTLDEALAKRNEARARRNQIKRNDATSIAILNAEYDWGYWDAVVKVMKNCELKEVIA